MTTEIIFMLKQAMRYYSREFNLPLTSTFSIMDGKVDKIAIVYKGKRYVATIQEVESWPFSED